MTCHYTTYRCGASHLHSLAGCNCHLEELWPRPPSVLQRASPPQTRHRCHTLDLSKDLCTKPQRHWHDALKRGILSNESLFPMRMDTSGSLCHLFMGMNQTLVTCYSSSLCCLLLGFKGGAVTSGSCGQCPKENQQATHTGMLLSSKALSCVFVWNANAFLPTVPTAM